MPNVERIELFKNTYISLCIFYNTTTRGILCLVDSLFYHHLVEWVKGSFLCVCVCVCLCERKTKFAMRRSWQSGLVEQASNLSLLLWWSSWWCRCFVGWWWRWRWISCSSEEKETIFSDIQCSINDTQESLLSFLGCPHCVVVVINTTHDGEHWWWWG